MKTQSNEGKSRMQSISNLYLSPPIAYPSFPRSRYFEGISIFLYESYRARVLDIRKHVSEQMMIERLRKKRTCELGNRSEGTERLFFDEGE